MGFLSWVLGKPVGDQLESYCLQCGKLTKLCLSCEKCKKCCICGGDPPHADEHDDDYKYLDQ